ncbi:MAG: hypothetical protein ACRDNW_06295, partial [Trebonia sp.]
MGRGEAQGAAARALGAVGQDRGRPTGDADPPGVTGDGRHPVPRPAAAARAGRPIRRRTPPASRYVVRSPAWAARRPAPGAGAVVR